MPGPRRAAIIGINRYEDTDNIPQLNGAVNDATELLEKLQTFGGFDIPEEHFLTDASATAEAIRSAISDLFWKVDEAEVALFYFSGHGFQDGHGNGYLAPYDLRYEEPFVRGIRIQELRQLFLKCKNKNGAILLLDCCHSGIAAEPGKGGAEATEPFYVDFGHDEKEDKKEDKKDAAIVGGERFILASSGAGEKSREICKPHTIRGGGEKDHVHGLFTYHLLEAMNGEAADESHKVTLGRLHTHVRAKMAEHKDHECAFLGFGTGRFEEFCLVEACRRREVEEWFEKAAQYLQSNDHEQPECLIAAINCLNAGIGGFPDSPRATELKTIVDGRLKKIAEDTYPWLGKNRLELLLEFRDAFSTLEDLAAYPSFDEIVRQPEDRSNQLLTLWRVALSNGKKSINLLKRDLEMARRPRSDAVQPPSRSATLK